MKVQKLVSISLACGLGIFGAIVMPAAMADTAIEQGDTAYEYGLSRIKVERKPVTKDILHYIPAGETTEHADGGMAAIEKSNRPKALEDRERSFKTPKHNPRI